MNFLICERARAIGDGRIEGVALRNIGIIYDDPAEARDCLEIALSIQKTLPDKREAAITLQILSECYEYLRPAARSRTALSVARAFEGRGGPNPPRLGPQPDGEQLCGLGTVRDGGELHLQGVSILHGRDTYFETGSLNSLGREYFLRAEYRTALDYFYRAMEVGKSAPSKRGLAFAVMAIGRLHGALGEYDLALENLARSRVLWEEMKLPEAVAAAHFHSGIVYRERSDWASALENPSSSPSTGGSRKAYQ